MPIKPNRTLTGRITAIAIAAATACSDTPPASAFAAAVDATIDTDASIDDATATTADTTPTDTSAMADAGPEKTCGASMTCLLTLKLWKPGEPLPSTTACMTNLRKGDETELDALFDCIDKGCSAEVDAWDKGGDAELAAMFGCGVDKCPVELATCAGGEGADTCAKAVKCLQSGCKVGDRECAMGCLSPTTVEHSGKAGRFLKCALDACGGMAKMAGCSIPLSCGLKCPELAGL